MEVRGLYVHIPFCYHVCDYCDFTKAKYNETLAKKYLQALEIQSKEYEQSSIDSIYIGGGTPTALSAPLLDKMLSIFDRFNIEKEYTIEINPETFDEEKAEILAKHHINRASVGIQSFSEKILQGVNRIYDFQKTANCLKLLKQYHIDNISVDLMYGFENQNLEMLATDLEKICQLDISHVSIYDLEIHENSILERKGYKHADEKTSFLMYQMIIEFLNKQGFKQYEVSNFAKEGCQSYHNKLYWHYEDYGALGLGACGKIGNVRFENTSNFNEYFKGNYIKDYEQLDQENLMFENIMMNLRLVEGIDINNFEKRYHVNLLEHYNAAVQKNISENKLEIQGKMLKTTKEGMFVLNDILVDFMDYL